MKKFLTLFFAFTCLAFSEMMGQEVSFNTNQAGPYKYPMSTQDGKIFIFEGNIVAYGSVNNLAFGYFEHNNNYFSVYNFPSGVAGPNFTTDKIIPSGYYLITYNITTHEYIFIGGSYQTFNVCGIWSSSCNKLSVYLNTSFTSFQWKRNGEIIPGATNSDYIHPSSLPEGSYFYTCEAFSPDAGAVITSNSINISNPISVTAQFQNASDFCSNRQFSATINQPGSGWSYQWKKDGQAVTGATQSTYNAPPQQQNTSYSCMATCPTNNATKESNTLSVPGCFGDSTSGINYLLVQNVSTTGNNASNKTIQVQFDLSWGNTWWDDINWDAAWVFMKYKTAAGEWKHAKINPTGYDKGQGTPSIIQPTADKMGAFVRLGQKGQGNFNAEGMQLQWNYGLDGLNSVNGLEVKVFATEMVYQPQGDFTVSRNFNCNGEISGELFPYDLILSAPASKVVVVNSRLSPIVSNVEISLRIKGDAGLDRNKDGIVESLDYPTGYFPFYIFKYELSDQQYSDFLNCLSPTQVATLGVAGGITFVQGQYYASAPNRACSGLGGSGSRLLAYADWAGIRPMSFLELNKAFNGSSPPNLIDGNNYNQLKDASGNSGSGIYGAKDLIGNVWEPFIDLGSTTFKLVNGDGQLSVSGNSDVVSWSTNDLRWGNFWSELAGNYNYNFFGNGFRLCRSAE